MRNIIKDIIIFLITIATFPTSAFQNMHGAGNNAIQGNSNTSTTHTIINHYNSSGGDSYVLHPSSQINLAVPWNTPYLPGHFVNRNELRKRILEKLEDNNKTLHQAILVGLHGLGGIGKTYLALNMIYNPVKDYSFRGWFTANDESKLKADYFKLGYELGLFTDKTTEEHKIAFVKNWLNNNEKILLVFDNAPNMEVIEKYLPNKGDIIITSRNYKIPNAIELDVMEETEALELLKKLIIDPKCQDLVKVLGYLPLAISQAGCYIEQAKITISKYLELYNKEQILLLSSDLMPVNDKHQPVYITWALSIKEIMEKDKTGKAIELLNLISFCHFVDIPKIFLIKHLYYTVNSKTELEFNKIISLLREYSLIKITNDTVAIHHLIQDCIKINIEAKKRIMILLQVVHTIKKIYQPKKRSLQDYELVKNLLRQLETLSSHTTKYLKPSQNVALLLCLADMLEINGDYLKNEATLKKVLNIQKKYYNTFKDIETAITLQRLGKACISVGKVLEGKDYLESSLSIHEKFYDSDRSDVAFCLRNLGRAYVVLGDYNRAKTFIEKALDYHGNISNLEITHTKRRLGRVYLWLGNYNEAKKILEEVLEIHEKNYGRKHYETSFTLRDLARAHLGLENYLSAKALLEEALNIQRNYYDNNLHVDIGSILKDLGGAYLFLKDYTQAKNLLEQALNIQESHYGPQHPEIVGSLLYLAQYEYLTHNPNNAFLLIERAENILKNHTYLHSDHNYIKKTKKLKKEFLNNLKNLKEICYEMNIKLCCESGNPPIK